MIKIHKLSKKYYNTEVLHDINLSLPRFGLVVIYGESGCGKTTLLNCISGLIPFDGNVCVDTNNLEKMNDDELSSFRLRTYGFVFQDFKLYENETIIDNVMFPLDVLTNMKTEKKIRKCHDLLDLVNLNKNDKQIVNELSGGEKQRVAIARALANDPKIVIADEPTGALDYSNSLSTMDILEKISSKSLVIVVSHDKELTEKYADQIVEMEDGRIKNIRFNIHHKHEKHLPVLKNESSNKKHKISHWFLFHHTLHSIKQRKWRTLICSTATSLGLIGVGLSIALSSSISNNLKSAYSSLLGESQIMVSLKNGTNYSYGQYAGSYYEAKEIQTKYNEYIIDVGVTYIANFEQFFPNRNCIAFADLPKYTPIDGISVRHINEFEWLDTMDLNVYPFVPLTMRDDEIILGLTIDMIREICFQLHIERNVEALSKFLIGNDFRIFFDLENENWSYSDQQILTVKGFTLEKEPRLYHFNHLWNEYMLEECMRFPTSDDILSNPSLPWIMKKIPYLHLTEDADSFFERSVDDSSLDPFILELANESYYPWLMNDIEPKDVRRALFFSNNINHIPNRYASYFLRTSKNIVNPIFGNRGGYSIFPESLMMGFSNYTFFSFEEDKLNSVLDINSVLEVDGNENIQTNDGVLCGHFTKNMQNGVVFSPLSNKKINGREPISLDEIVVSSGFLKEINAFDISSNLYIASCIGEKILTSGKVYKEYRKIPLTIVGIIEDDTVSIYHKSNWTTSFFRSRIGISSFYLQTNTISFSVLDQTKNDETIKTLKKAFPNYEINNPLSEINESISSVCKYIGISLALFSFVAFVISVLLLSICNYLHILESKNEIGLARCIGINKKESKKFLFWHSYFMSFLSFLFSSIELFIVSLVSDLAISKSLNSSTNFSINSFSFLIMLFMCVFISYLSSVFVTNKFTKTNPLDALKR